MRRGDIVIVSFPGDYGKPRSAILIQGDVLNQADSDSMILALMTGTLRDAPLLRMTIESSPENGLQKPCQIMVDKLQTVRRERIGQIIGKLSDKELLELNRLLAMVVGLA